MVKLKTCSRCHAEKPLTGFYPEPRNTTTGRDSVCRECRRSAHQAWYLKNQAKFSGNPRLRAPAIKRCWKCKDTKPSREFGISRSNSDGLNPSCKECARKSAILYNKRRNAETPTQRIAQLWTNYRLRVEDYQVLLDSQDGKCGMCRCDFKNTPAVDHCHETKVVRGILCHPCNSGLGVVEREGFVEMARAYLARHAAVP